MRYKFLVLFCILNLSMLSCKSGNAEVKPADENVVRIDQDKSTDNITVLMSASAEKSTGLTVKWPDKTPKHFGSTALMILRNPLSGTCS